MSLVVKDKDVWSDTLRVMTKVSINGTLYLLIRYGWKTTNSFHFRLTHPNTNPITASGEVKRSWVRWL